MWRELEGTVLDEKVRLVHLLVIDPEPVFAAELLTGGPRCEVRFFPDNGAYGPVLERFLESIFFDHPNLARCFGAGDYSYGNTRYVYAAIEHAGPTLAEV